MNQKDNRSPDEVATIKSNDVIIGRRPELTAGFPPGFSDHQ